MWGEIAIWQEHLHLRPDHTAKTIGLYTQDARRFATWLQQEHPGLKAADVTPTEAKTYRDYLLAKRYAPTTINRALSSLLLFLSLRGDEWSLCNNKRKRAFLAENLLVSMLLPTEMG